MNISDTQSINHTKDTQTKYFAITNLTYTHNKVFLLEIVKMKNLQCCIQFTLKCVHICLYNLSKFRKI